MSYRRSKTFAVTPELCIVKEVPVGYHSPEACQEHQRGGKSVCFAVGDGIGLYEGKWYLITEIDIATEMPGVKQKILSVDCYGYQRIPPPPPFTSVTNVNNRFEVLGDGGLLWKSLELEKSNDPMNPAHNTPVINKMIDTYAELDFRLGQTCQVGGGAYRSHIWDILVNAEYYTDIPPELCDVKIDVKNKETNVGVSKAYVALMSGTTIVADGYTDGGTITFSNIDEGSYIIRISASGYYDFTQAIEVAPPSVWYTARLVPIPIPPLPWWLIPAVVSSVVIGGGAVAYSVLRKPAPPVVIMR